MSKHVSLVIVATDDQNRRTGIMTENINFWNEAKNQPDRCEITFSSGSTATVMLTFDQVLDGIRLLEKDHIRVVFESELS